MGRPRRYEDDAARQRAHREREQMSRRTEIEEARASLPVEEMVRLARAGTMVLSEAEEQAVRDHLGYAPSERRTLAERDAAARRMLANTGGLRPLSKTAFPHVEGRDDPGSWSLATGAPIPKQTS